jgi:hypothetical protein
VRTASTHPTNPTDWEMTDMADTTNIVVDKTNTIPLPGGGTGIVMPTTGEVVNPIHCSIKNLARLGPAEFDAVLRWVEAERAREADRLRKVDEELAETRRQIVADAARNEKEFAALREREPWKFA